jgi:hypothetical protein
MTRALFKNSGKISSIKCSCELLSEGNKHRDIKFFDKDGKQTEKWKHSDGLLYVS